uniref:Serine peptidase inhibitor Kazal type 9 n=1 Tax=Capra hircus TaxID=9925 RepID=A0A452EFC4_CAPHI
MKTDLFQIKILLKEFKAFYMYFQIDCNKYKMLPLEERFCYDIYAPICGSDGKTYSNDCYFCYEVEKTNNKLKFVHFGKC